MPDLQGSPIISVVIATRNRCKQLEGCLDSLFSQRECGGQFEVVVVNDGSTDDTAAYLGTVLHSAPVPVTVLNQVNTGVAIARNRGIAAATGAIIAFTDDDCLLPEDWIARYLQLWRSAADDVAGIGGPLDTICKDNTLVAQYLHYLDEFNHVPLITPLLVRPRHVSRYDGGEPIAYLRTSNSSFRAAALHRIGGFDGRFRCPGGEDPDLSYRLLSAGYTLRCSPDLRVKHLSRSDFGSYFGSLKNYVRGEFINRSNRGRYPAGSIRRTYTMIPLQKFLSLGLTIVLSPLVGCSVAKSRGGIGLQSLVFPALLVASKLVALRVALCEQFKGGSDS